jgi:hypothetical protein
VHRRRVALVLAALAIAWVAVILLLPYGGRTQPSLSFDTPYYVWRTRALAAEGSDVLRNVPTGGVPERPGFPSVAALLGAVTGADALTMTVVLRALAAIAIGLAAGVFAVHAIGAPAWTFAAFTVGVGASAAVVGTAVGSLDQLLADVFLIAAAAIVPPVTRSGRGFVAVGLLIAAAAITHWLFTGAFVVLLLVFGGALLVAPWTWGEDRPASTRRRRRVLLLFASTVGGLALALLLLPALPTRLPPASGGRGNLLRLGAYELPVLLPLAALGLVLGLRGFGTRARSPIVLAGLWAAIVPVALVASWLLPTPLKLFRVAPFALGVPLLATLALVVVAILLHARGPRSGLITGAVIVVAGLVLTTGSPRSTFSGGGIVGERIVQARAAAAYLDDVRWGDRPVVFLTPAEPRLLDRAVKSAVPPARVVDTWVFVGGPDDLALVDRTPAELSDEATSWLADAWPPRPADVLDRDPIVIRIGGTSRPDGVELASGVTVVAGPATDAAYRPPPPYAFGWVELLTATFAALAVLVAIGWGWARAMLDVSPAGAFGLAPALGLATLALSGTFAARLGMPLLGAGAIGVVIGTAVSGWALYLVRRSVSGRPERRATERLPG